MQSLPNEVATLKEQVRRLEADLRALLTSGGQIRSTQVFSLPPHGHAGGGSGGQLGQSNQPAQVASAVDFAEQSPAPGNPVSNRARLYAKDNAGRARLFYRDDLGTEYGPLDSPGAAAPHTHDHGSELTGLGDPDHDEIADADNDTGWRSEASADEDKLRARTAGTERMVIQAQSTSEGALLFKFIQHLRLNAPGILVENTGDGGDPAGIFLWYVFSDAFQLLRKTTAGNLFNTANYVEAMRVDRATGDMTVGNLNLQDSAATAAKTLRFYDNDLSNYIGVKAPGTAQSEDWVIVLPADDPAANEVLAVSSVSSPTVTTEWRAIGSYYAPTTYVFVADVAIDTNVTTGDNQGGVFHHSYDNAETVKRIITEFEAAPTGAAATIQLEYGDTDDLDTVASWTEIDLVSHTAAAKTIITTSSFTNSSIPANRLIRMNVDAVGSTEPGENLTVHLQVLRPLVAS